MKPIIKWVGGKTQLLDTIKDMLPEHYEHYYEPFLGGAALLLELNPETASVNDINSELINMYRQVRDQVGVVLSKLSALDVRHEIADDPKEVYYQIRDEFNSNLLSNTPEQAARFIYLNKHCFNGLYRVNKKGQFNVPFNGRLTGVSCDRDNLIEVSKMLQHVSFSNTDFADAVKTAHADDFVFFDSPYAPLNPTSFVDYTKEGFSYEDHVRLADLFKGLTTKGVKCMLTNHDTPLIRELYKDFSIKVVDVRRSINRNGSDRKGKEVVITNY